MTLSDERQDGIMTQRMREKGEVTRAGQRLCCFVHEPKYKLVDKINDYADQFDLEIESIDFMEGGGTRIAYVLYRKRPFGTCAECHGECPEGDYLCSQCRTTK